MSVSVLGFVNARFPEVLLVKSLISDTFSSSTDAVAVTGVPSPFLTVITYSPVEKLTLAVNVTDFLSSLHLYSPSCTTSLFLISTVAVSGTAVSNSATNVSALTALKLVIAPSI